MLWRLILLEWRRVLRHPGRVAFLTGAAATLGVVLVWFHPFRENLRYTAGLRLGTALAGLFDLQAWAAVSLVWYVIRQDRLSGRSDELRLAVISSRSLFLARLSLLIPACALLAAVSVAVWHCFTRLLLPQYSIIGWGDALRLALWSALSAAYKLGILAPLVALAWFTTVRRKTFLSPMAIIAPAVVVGAVMMIIFTGGMYLMIYAGVYLGWRLSLFPLGLLPTEILPLTVIALGLYLWLAPRYRRLLEPTDL